MECWIETEHHVALTCDLTDEQASAFYEWVKKNNRVLTFTLDGEGKQALVILYRDGSFEAFLDEQPQTTGELEQEDGYGDWDKNHTKLWDKIKCLNEFFEKYHFFASVKIYPKSAVPGNVPADFIEKRIRYEKKLKDREGKVPPDIAEYLEAAERIRGLYKNKPETESMSHSEQSQSNDNVPAVPTPPAANSHSTVSLSKGTRGKKKRTLWVRKQIDMRPPKSDKQIYDEWNKMSHSQRAATLGIPTDDPGKTHLYEQFKSVSNVTRIKEDYKLEKERQNAGK